jgi:hypothetical protein
MFAKQSVDLFNKVQTDFLGRSACPIEKVRQIMSYLELIRPAEYISEDLNIRALVSALAY